MQGKAYGVLTLVAAMLAGCADAPSRQAATPAAREKAAAVDAKHPELASKGVARAETTRPAKASPARKERVRERAPKPSEDLVVVTVTTTWTDAPARIADGGGGGALPVRRSGQGEGVFAAPLAVSTLEDPTVF